MSRNDYPRLKFVCDALERRLLLAAFQSDDFSGAVLDSARWAFVNPLGDAAVTVDGTNALISVPAGRSHDVWSGANNAARLMQTAADEDFELEVKFESQPIGRYALQGLIVEASPGNYLRFDFHSDGSNLRVFAASFVNNAPTTRYNKTIATGSILYLRVQRQASQWMQSYSYDGTTWTAAANFSHALAVSQVGVFAGNAGGASAPAYMASADYFFESAQPIVPEDGNATSDVTPPIIQDVQPQNGSQQVQVSWLTNELATGIVEYGLTDQYELGSVAQPVSGTNHSITLDLEPLKNYHFRIRATNGSGLESLTRGYMVRSGGPVQTNPVIDVWYGSNQSFGQRGQPQRWVNILGRVQDPDGIASLRYSLNGQSSIGLSRGPNDTRLQNPGDFNIELDTASLNTGANTLVITARDNAEQVSTQTVTINFTRDQVWPRNYTTDWAGAMTIGDAAQVVDGIWSLNGDSVRTVEMGYDRLISIGDVSWQDYEVTVPVTIHAVNNFARYGPAGVGILTRWSGHYGPPGRAAPNDTWWPIGGLGWYRGDRLGIIGNDSAVIAAEGQARAIQFNTRYVMKMRVESVPGQQSLYALKMWQEGTAEPTGWDLIGSGVVGELANGSILLLAHHADVTFGRATITEVADTPPVIQNVQSQPGTNQVQVTWQTSEPATAVVEYGLSDQYELGSVGQSTLRTDHAVTLSGLEPQTTYHFRVRATDASGNVTTSGDFVATTTAADPPAFASDDFSGGIDPARWTFVNPLGDGAVTTDGTRALISVPAGRSHDVWTGANNAARLMQPAGNEDLELEVKFESQPVGRFALQGLLVEASPGNYLRFDFFSDGATFRVFAASFVNSGPTTRYNKVIATSGTGALYMRVRRQGNQWTQSYSYDGTTWVAAANFSHALTVTRVGVFAGNAGGTSAPAFTAAVDYLFNTAHPIDPEDGESPPPPPVDTTPPLVQNVHSQPGTNQVQVTWQTNEAATAVVEYGLSDQYELGSVAQPTAATNHAVTLAGLQPQTTYHFRIRATDASGNVTTSGNFVVTTTAADPPVFESDDFSGARLSGIWSLRGTAGPALLGRASGEAYVELVVPSGNFDPWGVNRAIRLMQNAPNADFGAQARFFTTPSVRHQLQGIMVEQDANNWIRFDTFTDGSSHYVFAATTVNGTSRQRLRKQIAPGSAQYLQVKRTGSTWEFKYSADGQNWISAGAFAHAITVSAVGPFAGATPTAPGYTARVDFFQNISQPIVPEDGTIENLVPVPRDDAYSVGAGETITVDAESGVLANDTDGDGDALTATLLSGPANGALTLNPDGGFTYTAGAAFSGDDSFVYQVSDGAGNTDTATVVLQDAVMFSKHVADTTMALTHFVVPADFDGDGDLDLVGTSEGTNTIAWYKNDGDLNFTRHVIDNDLLSAYPASVADLDQDGDVDVLAGGYRADKYVWYENDGSGVFTRHDIAAKDGPHSIVAADVDADGDLDLLTASQDSHTIAWYENDGSQNFVEHPIDVNSSKAKSALPADMDGDGDVDIVTASFGNNTVAWYQNDGAGNFTKRVLDSAATGAYYALATDLDGDGDQDVVSASQLNNTITWYRNDGAAGFVKAPVDTNAMGARAVFAADVNGDGRIDVLAASVDDDTIAWHENNGDGSFTKHVVAAVGGAYGVGALDFDGDGHTDVLTAGRDDGTIAVYRQLNFVSSPSSSGSSAGVSTIMVASTADLSSAGADEQTTYEEVALLAGLAAEQ